MILRTFVNRFACIGKRRQRVVVATAGTTATVSGTTMAKRAIVASFTSSSSSSPSGTSFHPLSFKPLSRSHTGFGSSSSSINSSNSTYYYYDTHYNRNRRCGWNRKNYYSTSTTCYKIHSFGGDDNDPDNKELSQEEMQRIIDEEESKMLAEAERKKYKNWRPGQRKRPLIKTHNEEEFERELMPEKFIDDPLWTLRDKRCGVLAIKVGMMPVWDDVWGVRHATTVLLLDRNIVLGHKTVEKHGYSAMQVAAGERKLKNVKSSVLGQYKKENVLPELAESPPYTVREFLVTDEENLLPLNSKIHARHFVPGQNIDVSGVSKGKGFQGAMKRHNFKGMPASHGTSRSHRSLGSTGQCQDPGKVFKGKKMAGRMGGVRSTVQNLRIVKIDRGRDLIYVKGHVPGQNGNFVEIRDAVKKPLWRTDRVLGSLERPPLPSFEYDPQIDGTGIRYEEFMPTGDDDPFDPDYMDTTVAIKAQA